MPVWFDVLTWILISVFVLWFGMLFIACIYELRKQSERIKLGEKILELIGKYVILKKLSGTDDKEIQKIKNQIKIMWKDFKSRWEDFRFKEISREKVEKIEKFLVSEGIIETQKRG